MSYQSPRRQPLSLVQNKSNSINTTAGSGSGINNNNASPGGTSSLKKKLPSISAFTSLHTSPKASLETSREGRASLSFVPFTSPSSASSSSASSETAARPSSSGKLRARATTFSSSGLSSSITPYSSNGGNAASTSTIRSPQLLPSALGPARRTRSKTLSKSIAATSASSTTRPPNTVNHHTRKALSQDINRSHSCTFVKDDNLQGTLDLLGKHVEEEGRRLSLSVSSSKSSSSTSSSASGATSASNAVSPVVPMLSAPLMQRTPTTPIQLANGPTVPLSSSLSRSDGSQASSQPGPPILQPPFIIPDLGLVYPSNTSPSATTSANGITNSGDVVSQTDSSQAVLSPQVERLSNLINDLSLFLPRAESLSAEQLHAIQSAVDSILGKPSYQSASSGVSAPAIPAHLGNAIQLKHGSLNNIFADDMPTFYVGEPPSLHAAPECASVNSSCTLQPSQTLYDPSTPQDTTDADMLGASTKSSSSSIASLERNIGGIELQVQQNNNINDPPLYQRPANLYSFDHDLDLVPPRW
ncbi:hypothetical protein P389DRAFT_171076 [Cystobasidium minutum MCA 4210]|uniref:uncharacterized protein n=1 Tax=Cystobasidium minutum MCA 4210 TaxID=1397322 RepID=UPI0034CE210E|eukprot:jgi/Rhomi1/171076/fgenesh1_kg.4_\